MSSAIGLFDKVCKILERIRGLSLFIIEKQKRGVRGGEGVGGRKEKDHMREWSHPQKSLKWGT